MQKYGQHFLVNNGIIDKITSAVLPFLEGAALIEIGPGKGALTLNLIEKGVKNFTLIEIDPDMTAYLQNLAQISQSGVKIINKDFMALPAQDFEGKPLVFISNLPYIDAADILDKVLSLPNFKAAVFMFQREQAQRIMAGPGSKFYGPLSILSALRAQVRSLTRVQRGSFSPPPKVESEVLVFTRHEKALADNKDFSLFDRIVKVAFAYKRKNILNSLHLCFSISKEELIQHLNFAKIEPTARAQDISLQKYIVFIKNFNILIK